MSELTKKVGKRIRTYRQQLGYSQEELADLAGVHPTYIGQVERGEKNATLESIEKIASSLDVPLSQLFEGIDGREYVLDTIPDQCYERLLTKSEAEQELIFQFILELDHYQISSLKKSSR